METPVYLEERSEAVATDLVGIFPDGKLGDTEVV